MRSPLTPLILLGAVAVAAGLGVGLIIADDGSRTAAVAAPSAVGSEPATADLRSVRSLEVPALVASEASERVASPGRTQATAPAATNPAQTPAAPTGSEPAQPPAPVTKPAVTTVIEE